MVRLKLNVHTCNGMWPCLRNELQGSPDIALVCHRMPAVTDEVGCMLMEKNNSSDYDVGCRS